jgi:hypothetical protein
VTTHGCGAVSGCFAGLTGGLSLGAQVIGNIGAALVGLSANAGVRLLTGSDPIGPANLLAAVGAGAAGPVVSAVTRPLTQSGLAGVGEFATRRMSSSIISFSVGTELKSFCEIE